MRSICNTCGNVEVKPLQQLEAVKYLPKLFFNLVQCTVCGLIFIDPQPDPLALQRYYNFGSYSPYDFSLEQKSTFRKTIMQNLRHRIFSCRKNNSLNSFVAEVYNRLTYRSVPYCKPHGKILDIGCGVGYYLQMLKNMGWQAYGIELNQQAAQYARNNLGLNVRSGRFEEAEFPEHYFDIITSWHSLEHTLDPKYVLEKIKKYLKPKGCLLLGVPNFNSLDRLLFKKYWNGFEIPLHRYHFNPDSIKYLLRIAGFDHVHIFHTIRPIDMTKSLFNMVSPVIRSKALVFLQFIFASACIFPSILVCLFRRSSIIKIIASTK